MNESDATAGETEPPANGSASRADASKRPTVEPPLEELPNLPAGLTPGESEVLDLFLEKLDKKWEVYVQPHLNGLRPDFVLLHPSFGIAVFEVKDWDIDAMRYFARDGKLWASHNGNEFSKESDNPFSKVRRYKKEVFELYAPSLPSESGFGAITAGVIFTRATRAQVDPLRSALEPAEEPAHSKPMHPVATSEDLRAAAIGVVFPRFNKKHPDMTPEIASDLRPWLIEPDFSREQRQRLQLDERQNALVKNAKNVKYRRIRGSAGSGKSVVLAARAARLIGEGKHVLLVTFNITLMNYLRDLIARASHHGVRHRHYEIRHFHGWCKAVIERAGRAAEYYDLWAGDEHPPAEILNVLLPDLTAHCLSNDDSADLRYDAILVDEGQDFLPKWWSALRLALVRRGEMMLAVDRTQDIYGHGQNWTTQVMTNAGFRGRWNELVGSYRLPSQLIDAAASFATRFLNDREVVLPTVPKQRSLDLDLDHVQLNWVQVTDRQTLVSSAVLDALTMIHRFPDAPIAISDITLLAQDRQLGLDVVSEFEKLGFKPVHTFSDAVGEKARNKAEQRLKLKFYKGAASVKVTTLHSFKGWEGRAVVALVNNVANAERASVVYSAMTRLKRHIGGSALTIVCSDNRAAVYGLSWPASAPVRRNDSGALAAYPDSLRPVVALLVAIPGATVASGEEEVKKNGRTLGWIVCTLCREGRCVVVVDSSRGFYKDLLQSLLAEGKRAIPVHHGRLEEVVVVANALGLG